MFRQLVLTSASLKPYDKWRFLMLDVGGLGFQNKANNKVWHSGHLRETQCMGNYLQLDNAELQRQAALNIFFSHRSEKKNCPFFS